QGFFCEFTKKVQFEDENNTFQDYQIKYYGIDYLCFVNFEGTRTFIIILDLTTKTFDDESEFQSVIEIISQNYDMVFLEVSLFILYKNKAKDISLDFYLPS
ncbi:35217_t:CDS:2, partial [Gigaspora margarita]